MSRRDVAALRSRKIEHLAEACGRDAAAEHELAALDGMRQVERFLEQGEDVGGRCGGGIPKLSGKTCAPPSTIVAVARSGPSSCYIGGIVGTSRKLSNLENRLEQLEQAQANTDRLRGEIEQLKAMLEGAEIDPSRRMALLLSAIGGELETKLRQASKQATEASALVTEMKSLREQARTLSQPEAVAAKRFKGNLNRVYKPQWTGYACLYFDGGTTDIVQLLVGPKEPPEECICQLNTRNEINSYAGGVIRAGEYWVAKSKYSQEWTPSGVCCVFTPFQ